MPILQTILTNFQQKKEHVAFFINGKSFSYNDLYLRVEAIYAALEGVEEKIIAVTGSDNLDTYASILACWFRRCAFVPLSPQNPLARNEQVLKESGASLLLQTSEQAVTEKDIDKLPVVRTSDHQWIENKIKLPQTSSNDLMYVLFTSGSTGSPKGVAINRGNLEAYVDAFFNLNYSLDDSDRFLQMYDLTFDASVQVYLIPILLGASIYTVPHNQPKYLYAYKLMKEQGITVSKMVPSTLNLLKPYFFSIKLENLRFCIFGGEALKTEIVSEWAGCAPNARILNVYGPSEATVNCMFYEWNREGINNESNGVLSIGKAFGDTQTLIIDENENIALEGELLLTGNQVFNAYLNNPQKTESAFVCYSNIKYYKTGDRVRLQNDGNYIFLGRNDDQVKIQGYRIELGEIESKAMESGLVKNAVALTVIKDDSPKIILFAEGLASDEDDLLRFLKSTLPVYMIPQKVINCATFPRSVSGKIDRMALKSLYYN